MKGNRTFTITIYTLLTLLALFTLLPMLLLIISSFTEENTILQTGYSFLPKKIGLDAYRYLLNQGGFILNSLRISFFITVVGTASSLLITSLLAYPLSRRDFPLRVPLSFVVFFTLLFNGGLVPTYLVYTQIFHIKNTIFGLLVPGLLMNGFNVILVRTYFASNIPESILESAKLDGAGEWLIFFRIVLPLSLPILATVGLMSGLAYWNDWYNGLIYITRAELFSLQNILNRMLQDVQFLQANAGSMGNLASELSKIPTTTVRMAIATVGAVPILVLYPFFQRYFVKGIVIGAVKG
ncbi:MAG: carbohydrate ABC transporter permease [Treponema sp.]|jgi:putative aldouronate transport system permease protein|nr:carbohydrate ABC transporter permease [Treponema sp.]